MSKPKETFLIAGDAPDETVKAVLAAVRQFKEVKGARHGRGQDGQRFLHLLFKRSSADFESFPSTRYVRDNLPVFGIVGAP